LKGPEYKPEEGIHLADEALESGSLESVEKALVGDLSAGLRHRFAEAMAAKKNAGTSVEAGRLYVQKYVEFIHYAERLSMRRRHSPRTPERTLRSLIDSGQTRATPP
jgi:hypothetical protein